MNNKQYIQRRNEFYATYETFCVKWDMPRLWNTDITQANLIGDVIKTIEMLLREFDSYKHDLNEFVKDLKDLIDAFIKAFETDLNETIIKILTEWKENGKLEEIINEALFNQKLDKDVFVDYLESSPFHIVKRFDGETNDDKAFERMNEYFVNNKGGTALLQPRLYTVTKSIVVEIAGITIQGSPQTTIIKATPTFTVVGESVFKIGTPEGLPLKGINLNNFVIDCSGVKANGFTGVSLYDNVSLTNISIYNIHKEHNAFKFTHGDGWSHICQTVVLTNCIAERKIKAYSNKPLFLFETCNEFVLIDCKAFSGFNKAYGDTEENDETAYYMQDCLAFTFLNCSSVAAVGYNIFCASLASHGIDIYSPRNEGVDKFALITDTTHETIRGCHYVNPNFLNSDTAKISLRNIKDSVIETSGQEVVLYDDIENMEIRSDKQSLITYDGSKNTKYVIRDEEWKNVTLVNGWTGSVQYCIKGKELHFKGNLNGENKSSPYFTTLPIANIKRRLSSFVRMPPGGYEADLGSFVIDMSASSVANASLTYSGSKHLTTLEDIKYRL